ncbi:MAG: response regulator [Aestuariivita sp.]|nr:response regulator [Aestuariivita sp.]
MSGKVLLVEDEPNITEAIRFLLSREGWKVHTHVNGATAINEIERIKPDILVLDMMLPGRSGIDILRDLRDNSEMRNVPVLMLSARGQNRDRELAEAVGVDRFIAKPFSNKEILEAVQELAEQRYS